MSNDGPKAKETPHERRMRDIEAEVDREEQEWVKAKMDHGAVTYHMLSQVARIDALVDALMELGIISEEEMEFAYKNAVLKRLKAARAEYQPIVEETRKGQGIQIPRIVGPTGEPLL